MIRHQTTVTPLYPGSFLPKPGTPVVVHLAADVAECVTAVDNHDDQWFALEVTTTEQKRYRDDDGDELWQHVQTTSKHHIYAGDLLSRDDVAALNEGSGGKYRTLLANMNNAGWDTMVRTRLGNFQPVMPGDVVLTTTQLEQVRATADARARVAL